MRRAIFTLPLVAALLGCATNHRPQAAPLVSQSWKAGNTRVEFHVVPPVGEGAASSFYQIKVKTGAQQERNLVMASAHTLEGLRGSDPRKWIRMIQDPSGKALLLEDEVPNDCTPCSNYLWIRLSSHDSLEGTYLDLPTKRTGLTEYENPRVHSLQGDILTYSYTTGRPVSRKLENLKTMDKPTPPG